LVKRGQRRRDPAEQGRLTDLAARVGFAKFIEMDLVGPVREVELLLRNVVGDADREAGPWERMADSHRDRPCPGYERPGRR
jgi:hypothetical protein